MKWKEKTITSTKSNNFIEDLRNKISEGYEVRFNTFLERGYIYEASDSFKKQFKEIIKPNIIHLSGEDRYLYYFIKHGLEEGFNMSKKWAISEFEKRLKYV